MKPRVSALIFACLALAACAGGRAAKDDHIAALRDDPPRLEAVLRLLPKGGDLHNHLSGAIYAESYIRWAADGGLCVSRATLALSAPPCAAPPAVPASEALRDGALYAAMIDAWSMRDFVPGAQSGHDHFFAAFEKFDPAGAGHAGDMLAELAERAAAEHTLYLELMWSPGMGAARALGKAAGWDADLARLQARLLAAGLRDIVPQVRRQIDEAEAAKRRRLHCGEATAAPGCAVEIRFLAQVIRSFPPEQVFAQFMLAFALVQMEPRMVGLNLVAPEDGVVALRDYALQMRMLHFLGSAAPQVRIALHAGELALGLVPPQDLRFHIREAVEVAGARRIGHGVDIFEEDRPDQLLAEMAARRVLVEINLTSNDLILGVTGNRHPFPAYRRAGVPTALSTDDAGVSRIDLTHEYARAVATFGLGYADLKELSRNSLEYSFLPGVSLWRSAAPYAPAAACADDALGAAAPSPSCRALLEGSEKARLQWRLERDFAAFEKDLP
jgi:adenosine deaminase